ncbi:Cytochrome c-554 precursor [Botrimarina hoheduenensis]|uniref:Cytochrome c-554 n=2 Tax=Botrimarina hoheduenensis TaxID=2528000 RepID=A0A5C5VWW0_9BACT|nr:Cytochrome c-554 precursor [Botrimarina hoheduenensis]
MIKLSVLLAVAVTLAGALQATGRLGVAPEGEPAHLVAPAELRPLADKYELDEEARQRLQRAYEALEAHEAKPKPDPVETNGPIFTDWPVPQAALVITGEQVGYLEPCGCAGLENQKGGLKRRHSMVKVLRDQWKWPLVMMDAGEQVRYVGPQAEIKYRYSIESLMEIGYHAVGFGPKDLRTDLLGLVINLPPDQTPLTSASIGVLGFDPDFSKRLRVVTVGEGAQAVRVAITHVMGPQALAETAPSDDLDKLSPNEALAAVLPEIAAAKADQNVLMVYGDRSEAEAIAREHDVFDWVVAGRGSDEPPSTARRIEGSRRGGGAMLVEVGHKGMYAVVVGLYRDQAAAAEGALKPGQGWLARYQKVPLDHRWADSPEMHAKLVAYQQELATLRWEGLGLKPRRHPTNEEFAGSAVCADCHTAAWEVFEKTPHFWTTETLVALNPARHLDPECISCHAVGWEPQKYYPFASGWVSHAATPHLSGNGCENCHGPAARHAAVELGDLDVDEAEETALRQALHLEVQENEGNMPGQVLGKAVDNCLQCHDLDNSPDFDFQEYWPVVKHEGMD